MPTNVNYKREGNATSVFTVTVNGYALSYTGEEVNNAIDAAYLALVGQLNMTVPNMNTVLTISDASENVDRHGKEFRFKKLTHDNLGIDLHYYYDKLYKLMHLGQADQEAVETWRSRPLTVGITSTGGYDVTYALIIDSGKAPKMTELKVGEEATLLTPRFIDPADNLIFDGTAYRQLAYNDAIYQNQ